MSQSNVEIGDEVQGWLSDHHYKEGFYTDISTDTLDKGLNEAVVRAISAKRNEPEWMLEFRLDAYRHWLEMEEPHWLKADYPSLNYQVIIQPHLAVLVVLMAVVLVAPMNLSQHKKPKII